MKKDAILEFTLNGKKHTFMRRIDPFGNPVTTTNPNNAKPFPTNKLNDVLSILIKTYGNDNIRDITLKTTDGEVIPLKNKH